ncbi:MAG: ATP-binding protein [Oscillospiraceae bacterium]
MKKADKVITKPKRIQLNLILSVCIVIILFFALITKCASDIAARHIQNETLAHYRLLSDRTAQEITTWFSNEAQIVANQKAAIEIRGDFSQNSLTEYLTSIVEDYNEEGYIYDLYFVSTENVMSSGYGYVPDPSIDFTTRTWYVDAVNNDGLSYSSPYKDTNLDKYVVTISSTVYDNSGKFMGVLALDIFVDTLFEIAENANVPDDSYIFLIDGNLGAVTHPNADYGYINDEPAPLSELPDSTYDELQKMIETGGRNVLKIKDYDGVKRELFVSKVECCGWYTVAAISESVVNSSVKSLLISIAVSLFICLIIGVICTMFAAKGIMRELNAAIIAANAANETKGSFLANMSHEIRTPINAVIGMNEMILRENTDPNITSYALDIAAASRSLISIINDVLDFSKIESGKIEITESEFNIASIINDVVNMSIARLGDKEIELIVNAAPDIPVGIIGDELRIQQIIVNLMTNGIKYTNKGFVALKISCIKQSYGINLDISVRDSGIGISEENIEKLFTSFQQVDTKRNRSVEGTGLGLAITKKMVTLMGGFINVSSQYGVGTEFKVTIPLRVSDEKPFISLSDPKDIHAACLFCLDEYDTATAAEYRKVEMEMTEQLKIDMRSFDSVEEVMALISDGKLNTIFTDRIFYLENKDYWNSVSRDITVTVVQSRINSLKLPRNIRCIYKPFYTMSVAAVLNNDESAALLSERRNASVKFIAPEAKILIVDDNAVNLKVAAGLMKPYQMKVFTADSGPKAIEMLEAERDFDIVFMDHMMPVMDGVEAVGIIRKKSDEYFRNVPIVALTANTVNDSKNMFLRSGFNDFLAKPIEVSMLERILKKHLPKALRKNSLDHLVAPAYNGPERRKTDKPPEKENSVMFSPEKGLSYTSGDEDIYNEILMVYADNGDEMHRRIGSLFEKQDWKDYVIEVHALKSTSLSIGAEPLSELAKELEFAGKEGKYDIISAKNEKLLSMYSEVLEKIRGYLTEKGIGNSDVAESETEQNELSAIGADKLKELIEQFEAACGNFDCDEAIKIADEASGYSFEERPLKEFFGKAAALADNFEYEAAAELVKKAESELLTGGNGNG